MDLIFAFVVLLFLIWFGWWFLGKMAASMPEPIRMLMLFLFICLVFMLVWRWGPFDMGAWNHSGWRHG